MAVPIPKCNMPWQRESAEQRWYSFGRYYAMFPAPFVCDAIHGLTRRQDPVLDPFCGRGNGPFTACILGRPSVGIDINPVAWVFTAAKLCVTERPDCLIHRLKEVARAQKIQDRKGKSRFETMAWAPNVRAFLRAARRELNWKQSSTDRMLMAFIILHMQDKLGAGLSNALWPTIACSPSYAVDWWTKNGFQMPPEIDPVEFLEKKILWRYRYGIPKLAKGEAKLADAREALRDLPELNAGLLITSPPYIGMTDYWNEHWIRLWMLGHKMGKDWKRAAKHENQKAYDELLNAVFQRAKRHLLPGAAILVRSGLRRRTASLCLDAMRKTWPDRELFIRTSTAPHKGVSAHHGRGGSKAKELDFLILGSRGEEWRKASGFEFLDPAYDSISS